MSKSNFENFFVNHCDLDSKTIYIGDGKDGIDQDTAELVVKAFHIFNRTPDRPVKAFLNTEGGCQYNGFAIYDTIKFSKCHVDMWVVGAAMSMGAIILQAADSRFIYPNAVIMIHNGSTSLDDNIQSFVNWAEFQKKCSRACWQIFADRTGKPVSFWKRRGDADQIYTAQEALELGLVDAIVQ